MIFAFGCFFVQKQTSCFSLCKIQRFFEFVLCEFARIFLCQIFAPFNQSTPWGVFQRGRPENRNKSIFCNPHFLCEIIRVLVLFLRFWSFFRIFCSFSAHDFKRSSFLEKMQKQKLICLCDSHTFLYGRHVLGDPFGQGLVVPGEQEGQGADDLSPWFHKDCLCCEGVQRDCGTLVAREL